MSEAAIDYAETLPPLPAPVADAVASWRVAMVRAQPDIAEAILRRAAIQLWRTAAIAGTVHPHESGNIRRAIADELYDMAIIGQIDADNAQTIIVEAQDPSLLEDEQFLSDEPPPPDSPHDYGTASVPVNERASAGIVPATFITPAAWPEEAPPPVHWLAYQRIPRGDVTTLHGDGGAGKTDIALQLAANCAREAQCWLGHEIAGGPVVVISGEEPEREVWRRIWQHGQRDGYEPASLANLHLWFPDDVGAVLATPNGHGIMQPTPLFRSIEKAIAAVAPVLVVVDNVAATFAGNQNDRVMVRSYVNLWRSIARQASSPAVLLLDHPSLSGLTGGTGRGGNMDWRNAVRSALYLRSPEDRAEADRGIRTLETAKSNYGPSGNPVRLQWGEGGLQIEHAPSSLHRLAKDAECEVVFLRLLDERNAQGRHVSDKSGKNYAPSVFEEMAGNAGFTAKPFASAMNRLFEARKIVMRTARRDGHSRDVIDRANAPASGAA
jgi:RecA-family ATPase